MILLPEKGVGIFAFTSKTYGGPSRPAFRAALALQAAGALPNRSLPVSADLARAYAAAKAVWASGRIEDAPLANNMLLDHDSAGWAVLIAKVKAEVGDCAMDEPIAPVSAMEGRFGWACAHGRVTGRVQRAPVPGDAIQALEFVPAAP